MLYTMPLQSIHNTYVMFNSDKTVAFITTRNMKNLETIGIFAGDEEGWVYRLLARDKNEIKKLKCYPYQKTNDTTTNRRIYSKIFFRHYCRGVYRK